MGCVQIAGAVVSCALCGYQTSCGQCSACAVLCVQVCLAAVGLVCDLCRALLANILPHCDEIMQLLLENLGVSHDISIFSVHALHI